MSTKAEKKSCEEVGLSQEVVKVERAYGSQHITGTDNPQSLTTLYGCGVDYLGDGVFRFVAFNKGAEPEWDETLYHVKNRYTECLVKKQFDRFVYPLLSHSEQRVLAFIVDRTIGWGKMRERIRKTSFSDGIPNVTLGTGLSRPTVNDALRKLLERGLIRLMDRVWYEVDFRAIQKMVLDMGVGIMSGLRDSKQGRDEKGKKPLQSSQEKGKDSLPLKDNKDSNKANKLLASSTPTTPVEDIQKQIQETKKQFQQKLESLRPKQINAFYISRVWPIWVREKYSGAILPDWTMKEFGQVKQFIKATQFPEGQNVETFFRFVVERWFTIDQKHFFYLNKHIQKDGGDPILYPQYPDIRFVMKYKRVFLNAFQREVCDELSADYLYKKRLLAQGYSEAQVDQAITEMLLENEKNARAKQSYEQALKNLEYRAAALKQKEEALLYRQVRETQKQVDLPSMSEMQARGVEVPEQPTVLDYTKPVEASENLQTCAEEWSKKSGYPVETIYEALKTKGVEEARKLFF